MVFIQKQNSSAIDDQATATYLQTTLNQANLKVAAGVQKKLLCYVSLMIKWNRAYNLTAVRDPKQIIARHIMDSLSILPYLHGDQILDVGSGAGLPGIPLALLNPYKNFVLLDSNGKKTCFLVQMVQELSLANVEVSNARVEDYKPGYYFDSILSRAFSSIAGILTLAQHLCAQQGIFLVMKGMYPAAEIADTPKEFHISTISELMVPGVDGQRTLIALART